MPAGSLQLVSDTSRSWLLAVRAAYYLCSTERMDEAMAARQGNDQERIRNAAV